MSRRSPRSGCSAATSSRRRGSAATCGPRSGSCSSGCGRAQAAHGLIGEIDEEATRNGVIVCRDGFRATTAGPREFAEWMAGRGVAWRTVEVDGSSLFCEIQAPPSGEQEGNDAGTKTGTAGTA